LFAKLIAMRLAHPGLRSDNFYPNNWQSWQTQLDPQGYGVDVARGILIYHRWGNAPGQAPELFMVVLISRCPAKPSMCRFRGTGCGKAARFWVWKLSAG